MLPPNTLVVCGLALLFETAFGYPNVLFKAIGHPVTWIGRLIAWGDATFNRERDPFATRRVNGALGLVALLTICGAIAVLVDAVARAALPRPLAFMVEGVLASACLAQRSLDRHVAAVAHALECGDLRGARGAVGRIVGRDTRGLDEAGIARAAIESLAENFADGIVAPAFWIALFGLPGGLVYKAINTADSMIGHRTPRHAAFGFAAAKVDDLVNWPAARLAALWLVVAACFSTEASARGAWRIARRDSRGHASPNAGWPEAAMAGALGLTLGGPRRYNGVLVEDRAIGDGARALDAAAIRAALHLYRMACVVEIVATGLLVLSVVVVIARGR